MTSTDKKTIKDHPAWLLIALLIAASISFALFSAWKGYPPYRDIHLGTAIEYAQNGIRLDNTEIVGFNATGTPTIQELPLWQALVALTFKTFNSWWGWANVVSCLIFASSLIPLYGIGKHLMGIRGGQWTLVFYLSQPLVFRYFGLASTDGTSIAAAIWFWYLGLRLLSAPGFSIPLWSGALVAGCLAALLKLPFFMATGMGLFFYHLISNAKSTRNWISLSSVGVLAGVVFLGWTKTTDHLQTDALFPFVDLRISDPAIQFWYFGDWNYRLTPGNWIKGGWRFLNVLFGSFVLIGFCILGVWKSRPLWLPLAHILGCVLTTMIFSHLVLHHSHYYFMFAPAVALLSANAWLWLRDSFPASPRNQLIVTGVAGLLFAMSLIQGLIGMKISAGFDPYYKAVASQVEKHTTSTDKLLIQGGGWGGNILLLSGRHGLSIWDTKFLEDEANLKTLKDLGYNKLVMISESPLLHAVQVINPGASGKQRDIYQNHRTSIAGTWPVLHQDDDVIIQEIP